MTRFRLLHTLMALAACAVLSNDTLAQPVNVVENPLTGRTWMDRNLGASQVATSPTDTAAYGDLYQWGRSADGHQLRSSSTLSELANSATPGHSQFILAESDWMSIPDNALWQGVDGVNNPCPSGFRLPTEAEWEAELATWTSADANGAFASPLKLTLAGARSRMSGAIGNVGTFVGYRTSNADATGTRNLGISSDAAFMGTRQKADGNCVRCILDATAGTGALGQPHWKLYPNPSEGSVFLQGPAAGVPFYVHNLHGQCVLTGLTQEGITTLSLDGLEPGVYLLNTEQTPFYSRFVKQ